MICLACTGKHPQFKPLNHPTPMRTMPCQLCGGVTFANHEVGLPDKFLTVDEAFKRIAGMVFEPPKHSS